jgi:ATP-dependent protease ClpP protease subunit
VPHPANSRSWTYKYGKPVAALHGPRASAGARAYSQAKLEPAPLAFESSRDGDEITLDLMDVIGADFFGEGITAAAVQASLDDKAKTVRVRINSPGGVASEGTAIRSILRAHAQEHDAKIKVEIHGLAASAASIVAMAGDEISIAPDALFMIHEAHAFAFGEAEDMRHTADVLDKINGVMAGIYVKHTGKTPATIAKLMAAETWMDGEKAVAEGFADSVLEHEGEASAIAPERIFASLHSFEHTPKHLLSRYQNPRGDALVAALATHQKSEQTVNPKILALLGLEADATDEQSATAVLSLMTRADQAETVAKEYQTELATARAELASLSSAKEQADVAHRIKQLETSGRRTPHQAEELAKKYADRVARGPLAVELFLEDLAEAEQKEPLALTAKSGLDERDAPSGDSDTVITPADRKLYADMGASVSDAQILADKKRYAEAARNRARA